MRILIYHLDLSTITAVTAAAARNTLLGNPSHGSAAKLFKHGHYKIAVLADIPSETLSPSVALAVACESIRIRCQAPQDCSPRRNDGIITPSRKSLRPCRPGDILVLQRRESRIAYLIGNEGPTPLAGEEADEAAA